MATSLLSAAAVRSRCRILYQAARQDRLTHFRLNLDRLDACADYVVDTMRADYPTLAIPYHSRWRHFAAGGRDRWAALAPRFGGDALERVRARFDLAIVSVLLDAGAGARWRYREEGREYARSEGLAVASFHLFTSGALSADSANPLRADAIRLADLSEAVLGTAFQVTADNPLAGLEGRALLMRGLGKATPRPGMLADQLIAKAVGGALPAATILETLLHAFGPIWPGRIVLGGVPLGDVWRHPQARSGDATDGLVPLHKLSQWLAYSLIEPLQEAGIAVTGLDELTGLAEYRNGGLFLDTGVLEPRDAALPGRELTPDAEAVVEWRALTVILLDEIAGLVRAKLSMDAASLPLAKVLQGGTWSAGRRIARERRADGRPPLRIASDGTVF